MDSQKQQGTFDNFDVEPEDFMMAQSLDIDGPIAICHNCGAASCNLAFTSHSSDPDMGYYDCGCGADWTFGQIKKMTLEQLRNSFFVQVTDGYDQAASPLFRLVLRESGESQYYALEAGGREDLRNSRLNLLQHCRSKK